MKTEIGVIGLGVMGKSLSRDLVRNGFKISIYNRHVDGKEEDIAVKFKREYPQIHIPCLLEAANFFHGVKTANSPANLIRAQRDYFGAHTYQRTDDPSGNSHHTEW